MPHPAVPTTCAGPVPLRSTPPPISGRKNLKPLNALSLACLRVATPCDSVREWRERFDALVRAHGATAVAIRLDDLVARGYLTDGLPRVGFLTDKGRDALARWS